MPRKIVPGDVIAALGGPARVAQLCETTSRAVYNWKRKFPANTYVALQTELRKDKLEAPDSLWTMRGLPGDKHKPRKHKKRRGNGK